MIFDEGRGLSDAKQEYDPNSIINELRQRVDQWRALPNPAQWLVTPERARLLQHWRHHKFGNARPFWWAGRFRGKTGNVEASPACSIGCRFGVMRSLYQSLRPPALQCKNQKTFHNLLRANHISHSRVELLCGIYFPSI